MRWLPAALAGTALAACGIAPRDGSYRLDVPIGPARQQIEAIAQCPSPLHRLAIAAPPRRVVRRDSETIDLMVEPKGGGDPLVLHVRLHSEGKDGGAPTRVEMSLALPDSASELDLGEGRLIAPLTYPKILFKGLESYFAMLRPGVTPRPSDAALLVAQECRRVGRLLDDGAILISPGLAREVARQRRRDAINWLFQDNYQLRTNNDDQADWPQGNDGYPDS